MKQNAATPVPVQEWKSAVRLIIASLLVYYLRDIWINMIEAAGSGRSTYGYGPDVPTAVLELCRFIVIFAPILYLIGLRRFRNMLSGPDAASVSKLVVSAGSANRSRSRTRPVAALRRSSSRTGW